MNSATATMRAEGGAPKRPGRRPGDFVMAPERLAVLQPSRLSASRALIAKAAEERWDIRPTAFDIDAEAVGTATYRIVTPGFVFSFIAFSHRPEAKGRTGRIIGRVWDMMAALIEGEATEAAIESARRELPRLYAGRASEETLVWCRSNRSMRVFEATLQALAAGRQPPIEQLAGACYLMRNTGLDGNGTFGTRAFAALDPDHPLGAPLAAQMLAAYMMREFAADLVNHLARQINPRAAELDAGLRRFLGVGNGSALGLILFVNKHPRLVHNWIAAREDAIAEAKALSVTANDPRLQHLARLLDRAARFRREDRMVYEAFAPSAQIGAELSQVAEEVRRLDRADLVDGEAPAFPLAALADRIEPRLHPETFETFLSLLIELVPDSADARVSTLRASDETPPDAAMTVGDLIAIIDAEYGWALAIDMSAEAACRYVWYKSAVAEEPRRGPRDEIPEAINLGLDLPGEIQALRRALGDRPPGERLARFLMEHPGLRSMVGRVQGLRGLEYSSPHANIMGDDFVPIHLVRLMNVAFHGIDKTRDFLNRNLRGVLFHGAPLPDDLRAGRGDDWFYPAEPAP